MQTKKVFASLLAILSSTLCKGLSLFPSKVGTNKPIRSLTLLPSSTFSTRRSPPSSCSTGTALLESVANGGGGSSFSYDKIDWAALVKYPFGVLVQMSLMFGLFAGIDRGVAHYSLKVPFAVHFIFLYAFNLKSSLFSILPSKKSDVSKMKQGEDNKRKQPSWTPPGLAFVFGWPLLTFGLRAYTGAMVVQSLGSYANPAIMSLMLHLCTGSLWNTVNNVENRLGVSVIVLYGLWLTKAFAAFQFYKVEPLAGKLLACTLTWITAACALETRTWQINPDQDTGTREPLIPMQHPKWSTKFRWEQ